MIVHMLHSCERTAHTSGDSQCSLLTSSVTSTLGRNANSWASSQTYSETLELGPSICVFISFPSVSNTKLGWLLIYEKPFSQCDSQTALGNHTRPPKAEPALKWSPVSAPRLSFGDSDVTDSSSKCHWFGYKLLEGKDCLVHSSICF